SCFDGAWRAAIEHFQHAIDRDPQFSLAHVALASAYNFLGFYSLVKPNLAFVSRLVRNVPVLNSLEMSRVARELERLLGDTAYLERSASVAEVVRAEKGADAAADALDRL